ncbi:MAG: autotransporter-associated beta strand repeat-containing protein, partial [Deltaproteobacteria bacterium]|nr:autotransporter-associated beta strand repeat-containing protein [Deltaproteobacteria bacterium]
MKDTITPVPETPPPGAPFRRVWRLVLFIVFVALCQASLSTPVAAKDLNGDSGDTHYGAGGSKAGNPVNGGKINVNGGHHSGWLFGGRSDSQVANCEVNLYGGSVANQFYVGWSNGSEAIANKAVVKGGEAQNFIVAAYAESNGPAYMNSVEVISGSVAGGIVGARGGEVSNNTVTISGGTVSAIGKQQEPQIRGALGIKAERNKVIISGGAVNNDVIGAVGSVEAKENAVEISGGTISGTVYGGKTGSGTVTGNTVTIEGSPTLKGADGTGQGNVYGGFADNVSGNDVFTGNTLNKNSDVALNIAGNFENVNFGHAGQANIANLDLTPTGASAKPMVKVNTDANDVTFGGVITGTGGFEKKGTGTLTLSGANVYEGATLASEGILAGSVSAATVLTVASGATYQTGDAERTVAGLNGAGSVENAKGLTVQSGTFSGVISGDGYLTKSGNGTLTLSGTIGHKGATT